MSRPPSYPKDTPIGEPAGNEKPAETDKSDEPKEAAPGRRRHMVTGAAIGIGSAALVAALLYANRSRKGGKDPADKVKP